MTPFFSMPNIAGTVYDRGPQPIEGAESFRPWAGHCGLRFNPLPYPSVVPVLRVLASNPGRAMSQAIVPVVNRFASLPGQYLTIGGFVSKSQG